MAIGFFDSPEIIENLARENSIQLEETSLFYCEVHEMEFDGESWHPFAPEPSVPTNIVSASRKQLEGFDVVTFYARSSPEWLSSFVQFFGKRASHKCSLLVRLL